MSAAQGAQDAVVVVAGGVTPPAAELRALLPARPALVVAADSGVSHAELLGLSVDVVVGDLDSVDPDALRRAEAAGARVEQHRVNKDKTDLELALDAAVGAYGADASYVVVGSVGGRLDHALANVLLLASPAYEHVSIDAYIDDWHITVVRGEQRLRATPGGLVTLLPVGGDAVGVVTAELRYPLRRETLPAGTTRGVSNVADAAQVRVGLDDGVLLALRQWRT
ncbi:MAG TPA: thiamine diphosphokinase [Acidimicrobiales bacterium]